MANDVAQDIIADMEIRHAEGLAIMENEVSQETLNALLVITSRDEQLSVYCPPIPLQITADYDGTDTNPAYLAQT